MRWTGCRMCTLARMQVKLVICMHLAFVFLFLKEGRSQDKSVYVSHEFCLSTARKLLIIHIANYNNQGRAAPEFGRHIFFFLFVQWVQLLYWNFSVYLAIEPRDMVVFLSQTVAEFSTRS